MRYSIALLLCIAWSSVFSIASAQTLQVDLENAIAKLETGTAQLEQKDPRSSTTLSEAAAQFEGLILEYNHQTPGIYHALGNAYMLNSDLGHAMLSYRKGEQLDPTHVQIRAALDHARSIVPVRIEPNKAARVWDMALSWRGLIKRSSLWYAFVACSLLGWGACSVRVLGTSSRKLGVVGIWLIGVSVVPLGMLGSEYARYHGSSDVVIISTEVNARSGPDHEIYDAVFSDGLEAGIEGTILETRNNWHRLKLADSSQCWVPVSAVGKVNPER